MRIKKMLTFSLVFSLVATTVGGFMPSKQSVKAATDADISSILPDYFFNMNSANSNVVAVAREGDDTSNFTAADTWNGVMPTEETAKTKGVSLTYSSGKNGRALYLDRSQSYGAELKNVNLGNGSWTTSFWYKGVSFIFQMESLFFTCSQNAAEQKKTKWFSIIGTPENLRTNDDIIAWSHNAERDTEEGMCFPWFGHADYEEDSPYFRLNTNQWYYITLVVDSTKTSEYGSKEDNNYVEGPLAKMYIDGELYGEGTVAPDIMSSTNKFFLGINLWDAPLKAYYDDVALWKRSLSDDDVTLLYQAESAGKDFSEYMDNNNDNNEDNDDEQ